MDDADLEVVHEDKDGGSVEGLSEADVVQAAVVAERDSAGVDAVVADSELGVGLMIAGGGFGPCVVGRGRCRVVWQ